jgi:replication factor C small subunit
LELVRKSYPDLRRIINDIQKFSFTGTLNIKTNSAKSLAETVVTRIKNKVSLTEIRKYVIEHEQEFSGDYHFLLKEMFENIFIDVTLDENIKKDMLLTISESMYKDAIVTDKEINWFSCCLKL